MSANAPRTKPIPKKTRRGAPRRRRVFAVAGLVVASIVFAAIIGEAVVRVRYGPKFRPRAVFGVGDAHLGWKPSPNLNDTFYGPDYSIHIRTDHDGYRLGKLGEVDYTKQLIVLLGDSYAFGWGLSTDDTFASQLDALVSAESNGATRLVNLGVGGYGILQNADRLEEFLRVHPEAKVAVVIQQHCMNDAVDNFRSIGYHLGQWENEPVERPRSRSHLLNMIAYARAIRRTKASPAMHEASDADGADMLWSYQRKGTKVGIPTEVALGGRTIHIDPSNVADNLAVKTEQRPESLASTQRELMAASLNELHTLCKQHTITVVHTFIATTPAWYVDEVSALAIASATETGCRVVMTGMVPSEDGTTRSIRNENSAGHFNAEFSRYWAQRLAQVLDENGAITR